VREEAEVGERARARRSSTSSVAPTLRKALRRRLLAWYDTGHRDLPWRFPQGEADPYRVWLAEVMLQQTQVATALPYYLRFVARYPTLEALASARDDDVVALWSGLGYYARCRNLLAAARQAIRTYGGLPRTLESLRTLPGFGPYTAGAVASIAFGICSPAVDGNVVRVLSRVFALAGDPSQKRMRERIWSLAAQLVPESGKRPGDFNQALMELGATLCTRSTPACERCPVASLCEARRTGREERIPLPRRRRSRSDLLIACAVIERSGAILLARRPGKGLFGGLWELPGVEVSPGVRPQPVLRIALAERLGTRVRVGSEVGAVQRTLTHRELTIRGFYCVVGGAPWRCNARGLRWQPWNRLGNIGISAAMRELLHAVASRPLGRCRPTGQCIDS
jgi:A/G-specific adenine glycosylase